MKDVLFWTDLQCRTIHPPFMKICLYLETQNEIRYKKTPFIKLNLS